MTHKPIQIQDIFLSFSHKTCFEDFNDRISYASRIAIIGRNGSGKSTLLKMISKINDPSAGSITYGADVTIGYVPQVIEDHVELSGGERLNRSVTEPLIKDPNVLLLDEPTHLDSGNRKILMRMPQSYPGTWIVVSHDRQLLRHCIDTLWHIDQGEIHVFSGHYDDYIQETQLKRASIESELSALSRQIREKKHPLSITRTKLSSRKN